MTLKHKLPKSLESSIHFADKGFKIAADEDGEGESIWNNGTDEKHFTFLQFHFHSPSEHTINGEFYDAEVHFVHVNDEDPKEFLVVGVFLDSQSKHFRSSVDFFSTFSFD